ncbi:MAG: cupin domain-containing protein [Defluviitaleaceae bacterium]|nr:cupin domain-containing protein [Defluviitaleaceae bacterium]
MFTSYVNATTSNPLPGVTRRVLAYDDHIMLVEFTFDAGVHLPHHSHPHNQVSYVKSGKMEFTLDGEVFTMNPGDSITIPPDVIHGALPLEASMVLDVFTPARQDFL